MDGDRFDDLTRALAAHGGSRRRFLGGLAAAAVLLGGIGADDAEAHSTLARCRRITDRKKRAACIRRARAHARTHAAPPPPPPPPPPTDAAPLCTADGCPLPPGCSQEAVDACAIALRDRVVVDAEPCRAECEADPNAAACQQCLAPFVRALLPEAEACLAQACSAPAPSPALVAARAFGAAAVWWERRCATECCSANDTQCREDLRDEFLICLGGTVAAGFATGGAAVLPGIVGCTGKATYNHYRCVARYGCQQEGSVCVGGNRCCPVAKACATTCCGPIDTCVEGACKTDICQFCTDGSVCCPPNGLFGEFGYCCSSTQRCVNHGSGCEAIG